MGQLANLHAVERTLEDDHLVTVTERIGRGVPDLLGAGRHQDHLEPRVVHQQASGDLQGVVGLVREVNHRHRGVRPDAAEPANLVQPVGAAVGEPHLEGRGLGRHRDKAQEVLKAPLMQQRDDEEAGS